jgi:hypothetical protein
MGMPGKTARNGLTSFGLKALAIALMLADHIGAILPVPAPCMYLLRGAGRLAFPIFAFLISEGYRHTRSPRAYALRLAAFALISEIPFNLLYSYQVFDPGGQNIFFTLLIGLLAIIAIDAANKKIAASGEPLHWGVLKLAAIIAAMLAAELLRTDYGAFGVIVILIFHAYKGNRPRALAGAALACALFGGGTWLLGVAKYGMAAAGSPFNAAEALAALSAIPIYFYSGKKGPSMKYFFYAFYPLHITALVLAKALVFRVPVSLGGIW